MRALQGDAVDRLESEVIGMKDALQSLKNDLALAHRVLVDQGVMDAFGHVSVRHPDRADRFLLPVSGAPSRVTAADIIEYDMNAEPVEPTRAGLFSERIIHSAIYRARPDVGAVCHHHSPSLMPFCQTGAPLRPSTQTGASMGAQVPFWDSRDEFGDTKLLVVTQAEGDSLARALGPWWLVLMRRHGATAVGRDLYEVTHRSVHACADAASQLQAVALGEVQALSEEEQRQAGTLRADPIMRCWSHWTAVMAPQLRLQEGAAGP
jgi:HCOMODA/2-hydroxy-3-carboxy-muconic semialdehyde decarboxylase